MAASRREHTREPGVCKHPLAEPEQEWSCPACARVPRRPNAHPDHTLVPGDCRVVEVTPRDVHTRRRGSHPCEATIHPSTSPSACLDGPYLNPDDAPQMAEPPEEPPAPVVSSMSASSGRPSASSAQDETDSPARGRRRRAERTHAPDPQPRVCDAATGEAPNDWTRFDVTKSLLTLRSGTPEEKEREVRKLHLR